MLAWFKEQVPVHRPPGHSYHSPLIFLQVQWPDCSSGGGEGEKEYPPFTTPKGSALCSGTLCILKELPQGSVGYYRSPAVHGLIKGRGRKFPNNYIFLPDSVCVPESSACCLLGALDNYRIALPSDQMLSDLLCRASGEWLIRQLSDE